MKNNKNAMLIITTIAMMIFASVSLYGCGKKAIADIPDPEYFFAGTYIDEINEHDDVKQVILRSDNELWTYAAAYVNLLKYSGKYQFESFDENLYPSGDYVWNFKYNGAEEVKDTYFAQIEINYYNNTNGRDKYAVWITIHDLDNFQLVENDIYDINNIYGTEPASQEMQTTSSYITDDSGSSFDSDNNWDSDSDSNDDFWDNGNDDFYDAKPICGVCDGDGDCGTCGGDGLLHSSASDKEDRNCYSCSGTGNCRSCGGDGEL